MPNCLANVFKKINRFFPSNKFSTWYLCSLDDFPKILKLILLKTLIVGCHTLPPEASNFWLNCCCGSQGKSVCERKKQHWQRSEVFCRHKEFYFCCNGRVFVFGKLGPRCVFITVQNGSKSEEQRLAPKPGLIFSGFKISQNFISRKVFKTESNAPQGSKRSFVLIIKNKPNIY